MNAPSLQECKVLQNAVTKNLINVYNVYVFG